MKRVLSLGPGFTVPDGTVVYELLNRTDTKRDREPGRLDDFSIAAGDIGPYTSSKVHVHPVVTQVTWIVSGKLLVKMKDPLDGPYTLELLPEQAAITAPGTFLQLINAGSLGCRVLYFVSPAFLHVSDNGSVIYNDALVLDHTWEQLADMNWKPPEMGALEEVGSERESALERLRVRR